MSLLIDKIDIGRFHARRRMDGYFMSSLGLGNKDNLR